MAETRDNWYKVDNVSKIFLATYNQRDTRSMRLGCTLTEEVDPEILKAALERTIKSRPQFQVRIRRGFFWHYLETTDAIPKVEEEYGRPCPTLYGTEYRGILHYKVSYFGKRINLDMFHALSDGTGALEFLNQLVLNYLKIKYPEELKNSTAGSGAAASDLEQDSFSQFYTKYNKSAISDIDEHVSGKKAYHIHGLKLPYDQLQFMEVKMNAKTALAQAKEMKVSLTSYVGAKLMLALYKDMPVAKRKLPITISLPVNLRNFFPSETVRNFFNSTYVTHLFTGEETLEGLAQEFDAQLKENLKEEHIRKQMDSYQKLEKIFVLRMVPLFLKLPVVRAYCKQDAKKVSGVLSNMGVIKQPQEIQKYVTGYTAFCSHNELFMTVYSYGEDLCFGISTAYQNTGVLKNFIRSFEGQEDQIRISATEVTL